MTKLCPKTNNLGCGRVLDVALFHKQKRGGYQHYCSSCMKIYAKLNKVTEPSKADIAREMCYKLLKETK